MVKKLSGEIYFYKLKFAKIKLRIKNAIKVPLSSGIFCLNFIDFEIPASSHVGKRQIPRLSRCIPPIRKKTDPLFPLAHSIFPDVSRFWD